MYGFDIERKILTILNCKTPGGHLGFLKCLTENVKKYPAFIKQSMIWTHPCVTYHDMTFWKHPVH